MFLNDLAHTRGLQIDLIGPVAAEIILEAYHGDFLFVDQRVHAAGLAGAQHRLHSGRNLADRAITQFFAIRRRHVGLLRDTEKHHVLIHAYILQIKVIVCVEPKLLSLPLKSVRQFAQGGLAGGAVHVTDQAGEAML